MVSFTRRTAGLGSTDLSQFVQRFEAAARDIVSANGGRVVKTIGDAILFVADSAATGALIALDLADTLGKELDVDRETTTGGLFEGARGVTPVRVGLVWGRVLSRFGDVFGPDVNLAARLTDIADPSTVLVDEGTATVLSADARFVLEPRPARRLRHGTPSRRARNGGRVIAGLWTGLLASPSPRTGRQGHGAWADPSVSRPPKRPWIPTTGR